MTHLTDERLNELEEITDTLSRIDCGKEPVRWQRARNRYWEIIDGTKGAWEFENTLITALRHEREAHQATRADRDQLRWHMANIVAQCGHRHRSCQRCEFAFTSGREALGKDAARAGQGKGAE